LIHFYKRASLRVRNASEPKKPRRIRNGG